MFDILFSIPDHFSFEEFFRQPIDVIVFQLILFFGWIPFVGLLVWGYLQTYLQFKQEKYVKGLKNIMLAIDVPRMTEQSPKAMENMFATLQGAFSTPTWKEKWILGKMPAKFSFEIVSRDGYTQFYVRCETKYRDLIEAGIYAQYPDAQIMEAEDYVTDVPSEFPDNEWNLWGTELTLAKDEFMPIRTWPLFEHPLTQELKDPLAIILEQMGRMRPGEVFWFQILCVPFSQEWREAGIKYISKIYGIKETVKKSKWEEALASTLWLPHQVLEETTGANLLGLLGVNSGDQAKPKDEDMWKAFKITLQEKTQVEGIANKVSKLGFKTKIRMVYAAKKSVYSKGTRVPFVKGMLLQFSHQDLNSFKMVGSQMPKDDYFWQAWSYGKRQTKLVKAYKRRLLTVGSTPKILNIEELATLFHFPSITVKAPLIKKTEARRAEPPVGLPVAFGDEKDLFSSFPPKVSEPVFVPSLPVEPPLEPEIRLPGAAVSPPIRRVDPSPAPVKESSFSVSLPPVPDRKSTIPDAIRVLIEPGVEFEDVMRARLTDQTGGKASKTDVEDEGGKPPENLPV